jgi:hypothetical protein
VLDVSQQARPIERAVYLLSITEHQRVRAMTEAEAFWLSCPACDATPGEACTGATMHVVRYTKEPEIKVDERTRKTSRRISPEGMKSHASVVKTHCPQGHAYDEENTLVCRGARYCRTCKRAREKVNSRKRKRKCMPQTLDPV